MNIMWIYTKYIYIDFGASDRHEILLVSDTCHVQQHCDLDSDDMVRVQTEIKITLASRYVGA